MNQFYCEVCQKKTDSLVIDKSVAFNHKNHEFEIESKIRVCTICNKQVYDHDLDQMLAEKAIIKYNSLFGVTGEQIVSFRNEFKLSQSTFSKAIGIAKKTLVSYENNQAIPSDHYMQILKSVLEKPDILTIFAENSDKSFTEKEKNKISQMEEIQPFFVCEDEYRGYREFNKKRLLQAILFLSENETVMTKLNKGLFYADFSAYKNFAVSITGACYQQYTHGPFIPTLYGFVEELVENNQLSFINVEEGEFQYNVYLSKDKTDMSLFNENEIDILYNVRDFISDISARQVSHTSHFEPAWLETEVGQLISYEYANRLRMSF